MDNSYKTILKNGVIFTIAPFIPKIVSIFLLPIMTQYLTDVDYGIAGTISSYSMAIGAFSTLGLTVMLMNTFIKYPDSYKVQWCQIYGFLQCWMWVYALLQAVILYFCIPAEAQENKWWIILLTNFSTVFFGPTGTIGNYYYIYSKQSFPIAWRSVMAGIITLLANFIMIVYFRMGYMGWYIGTFVGTFFTNASYWFVIRYKLNIKPTLKLDFKFIRESLKVSLPTVPHFYTSYLLEGSGRMIMDQNDIEQGNIGRVSISQQFGTIFQVGVDGLNNAMSPYIMQYIKTNEGGKIKKLALIFIFLVFLAGFTVSLWSKEIFLLLLKNETLQSAYPYLIVIIMAICSRALYLVVSNYYFFYEYTKQLLLVSFGSGIIATLLYLSLVPRFGVWGFLISYYIAQLYMGYSGYFFKCYKDKTNIKLPIYLILPAQLALTIASFVLVDLLLIKIIVTTATMVVLIFLFKKIFYAFKRK